MEHSTPAVLILIILFVGPVLWFVFKARKGQVFFLRRVRGIDEIDSAIGRAVEEGRPVSFSTGVTDVSPLLYACLGILHYVTEKTSKLRSTVIVPARDPESLALFDATMQSAYQKMGRLAAYDPAQVRFLSSDQLAYASGYQGITHRENTGAAFLFGSFAAESLILAEAGQQVGAMQIAGTTSSEQIPFFVTSCDYTLIGEELYAASAYLTKDPTQLGSMRGQDIAKLVILVLILLGVVLESLSAYGVIESQTLKMLMSSTWDSLFFSSEVPL